MAQQRRNGGRKRGQPGRLGTSAKRGNEIRVIPLTMRAAEVAFLDEAAREFGFSRSRFVRMALRTAAENVLHRSAPDCEPIGERPKAR